MGMQAEITEENLSRNYIRAVKDLPEEIQRALKDFRFYEKIFAPQTLKEELEEEARARLNKALALASAEMEREKQR